MQLFTCRRSVSLGQVYSNALRSLQVITQRKSILRFHSPLFRSVSSILRLAGPRRISAAELPDLVLVIVDGDVDGGVKLPAKVVMRGACFHQRRHDPEWSPETRNDWCTANPSHLAQFYVPRTPTCFPSIGHIEFPAGGSFHPDNPNYAVASSLAGSGNYIAMGDRKMVIAMKLGSGAHYVAIDAWMSEQWKNDNAALVNDPDKLRQSILEEHFGDWPKIHTDLIRHSNGRFHTWPLYSLSEDVMNWQSVPGVTLVGDAAHLAVTNGDGVNVALYDSYCLAEQIVKHGQENLDAAVAEYEKEMFPRGVKSIKGGQQWIDVGFGPDTPARLLEMFGAKSEAHVTSKAEATSTVACK